MLPTGMPSSALIWAYGTGGLAVSSAISCWQQRGQTGERLEQRGVALSLQQFLLRHRCLLVRDGLSIQQVLGGRASRFAQGPAAFPAGRRGDPAG
jgi:hypothetical protein